MMACTDHNRRVTRRTARVGLTLIEILMTIFVLAVGLLGVAALMPVGSYQMQRGQIAQRVSEIGPAALDVVEATEMHSPGRWLFSDGTTFDAVDPDDPSDPADREDAVRIACPISAAPSATSFPTSATGLPSRSGEGFLIEFARCQNADLYKEQWRAKSNSGTVTYLGSGTGPTPDIGDVYVLRRCEPFAIDPLFLARDPTTPFVSAAYGTHDMPRITISGVLTSQLLAEAIFQNDEDLMVQKDSDGVPTGREVWGPDAANPIKAKSEGNYSWLATFAPGEAAAGSDAHQWTVSVAVFYKRPLALGAAGQWTVPFTASAGSNGYTTATLIGKDKDGVTPDPTLIFEDNDGRGGFSREGGDQMRIKRRQWGLVTFLESETNNRVERRARWYRLGTVGRSQTNSGGYEEVKVRLIGPDLPKIDSGEAVETAKITFFEGLEGVFTRTMTAEELPVGPN